MATIRQVDYCQHITQRVFPRTRGRWTEDREAQARRDGVFPARSGTNGDEPLRVHSGQVGHATMPRRSRAMEHTTNTPPAPDRRRLQTTLARVVSRFSPEQIVLFGSASRHEMTADSDVDLLVIRERLNGEPETDRKRWENACPEADRGDDGAVPRSRRPGRSRMSRPRADGRTDRRPGSPSSTLAGGETGTWDEPAPSLSTGGRPGTGRAARPRSGTGPR